MVASSSNPWMSLPSVQTSISMFMIKMLIFVIALCMSSLSGELCQVIHASVSTVQSVMSRYQSMEIKTFSIERWGTVSGRNKLKLCFLTIVLFYCFLYVAHLCQIPDFVSPRDNLYIFVNVKGFGPKGVLSVFF